LAASAALVLPAAWRSQTPRKPSVTRTSDDWSRAVKELDAKIESAMAADAIPGAAVGVIVGDRQYLKGYGVTNVDSPAPVDADTAFRIQSTTKTFTGTALMQLVEQGSVDLDARVRRYLPDFATSDEQASSEVTVRQLANHTAGWLGDYFPGFDQPDGALASYVASMRTLPQLTRPGAVFAYSNAALCTAGRLVEVVTGSPYDDAIQSMLLSPLELHSSYFSNGPPAAGAAVPHVVDDGTAVVKLSGWDLPRSEDPTGGLISTVRDQMAWARFHLGDGRAPTGARLLRPQSLVGMRSRPGPGGTLLVELNGMGVTWMLRPSAEGAVIVQHGGTGTGQLSGFMMVPSRGFAMTLLTNSDGASSLRTQLFTDDWALRRFAGVSNLPATPRALDHAELAPYEGRYVAQEITAQGVDESALDVRAQAGRLQGTVTAGGQSHDVGAAFARGDVALDLNRAGRPTGSRSDFIRGPKGSVLWWRRQGRLNRHVPATTQDGATDAPPNRDQP
jgi:CubicO group peptidase (beta-lactamase class C family)